MQTPEGAYFTWNADPILFSIPEFDLPIPLSIWGLLAGFGLLFWLWNRHIPSDDNARAAVPSWKPWSIILGSLISMQLIFWLVAPHGPTLDTIGPVQPRWYGLMFACAFIFGYLLASRLFRDAGRTAEEMDRLLIYILVATIIGARFGHILFYNLDYYLRNPHLILAVWRGGLASHGAAIGIIIAMWLYVQKTRNMSFLWLADRVVPSVAIGGMFIRIGNFFNSEILGEPTTLPWAVVFERIDSVPRHPSMLYESLSTVMILGLLLWIYKRFENRPPEGALFGTFLVTLFTGRFLIEFTKLYHSDFEAYILLNMGQWLSIPMVLFGIWILFKKVKWAEPAPDRRVVNL
ncbi:MAG: prolipoprotein diacylglyceryl transferase [Balneolaceae bacterium]